MKLPDMPQPGKPISVKFASQVIDALRAIWPQESPTIKPSTTAGGTTYKTKVAAVAAGSFTRNPLAPWQPKDIVGLNFGIRSGFVVGFGKSLQPANATDIFTCPANTTDGFFVWLKATITGAIGSETIASLEYGNGLTVPVGSLGDPATGAVPSLSYFPIMQVTSTLTAIDSIVPMVPCNLTLGIEVQDISCDQKTRTLSWGPVMKING